MSAATWSARIKLQQHLQSFHVSYRSCAAPLYVVFSFIILYDMKDGCKRIFTVELSDLIAFLIMAGVTSDESLI